MVGSLVKFHIFFLAQNYLMPETDAPISSDGVIPMVWPKWQGKWFKVNFVSVFRVQFMVSEERFSR